MHIKLACKAFTDKLNTREISYLFRTIEGSFLIYLMLHLSATFRQQWITFSGSIGQERADTSSSKKPAYQRVCCRWGSANTNEANWTITKCFHDPFFPLLVFINNLLLVSEMIISKAWFPSSKVFSDSLE